MNQTAWNKAQAIFEEGRKGFVPSVNRCEETQQVLLAELVRRNRDTDFGQTHGFDAISNYQEYIAHVPLTNYEGIHHFIEKMVQGEKRVLTEEDVCFAELTGGSAGGAKVIPYTPSALAGFQKALFPWFADLLQRRHGIKNGSAYFSISPAGREENTHTGVLPLGNNDDATYFGAAAEHIRAVQAVSHAVARIKNMDDWRFMTARLLLEAEDLTFIFIWSPTFLLELIQTIHHNAFRLTQAIANGEAGIALPTEVTNALPPFIPNPARSSLIEAALTGQNIDTSRLWPKLDTVSCWMDASSAPFARQLQALFPHAYFQPKGLLSTEAAVSIPFGDEAVPVLAIESAFFEFVDEDGNVHRAHQLCLYTDYRVIVSNHSGLYRYDTGDLIRVAGYEGNTPRLIFLGRVGLVIDLCGEKLSEAFVLRCFEQLKLPANICAFLVPYASPHPHYTLFIDSAIEADNGVAELADKLDILLRQNPQYDYARKLGQLSPLRWQRLSNAYDAFCTYAIGQGRQIGTLKPPVLLKSFILPDEDAPILPE